MNIWKKLLKKNITTLKDLKKYIKLKPDEEKAFQKVVEISPLNVTKYYLSLIRKNDFRDPVRRMIIPSVKELSKDGQWDTSGEERSTKFIGLQHKYHQTALLLCTNYCAAYCRFCFRKRMVGLTNKEILSSVSRAVKYIKKHKEINNVLLSGGDPLALDTKVLDKILSMLAAVKHLDFIRIGSRIPVVLPMRIYEDAGLLKMLKKHLKKKRIYITTHFNHPNEITPEAIKGIDKLLNAGVLINNQTVLLSGVNDGPKILAELLSTLVKVGVTPYYVFQCRPVTGIKHFQVSLVKGIKIVGAAKKMMNGYAKRFKYMMSHETGKIEIIGTINKQIVFKYHQSRGNKITGRTFLQSVNKNTVWLDDVCAKKEPALFTWIEKS